VNKKPLEVAALSGLLTIMIRLIQQVCLVVMYSEKENI